MNRARWSPLLGLIFLLVALVPAHAQRLVGVTTATQTLSAAATGAAQDVGVNADIGVQMSGTWSGTMTFQATVDKTTWTDIRARRMNGLHESFTTANGQWVIPASGYQQVRVYSTALASGTVTITWYGSAAAGLRTLPGLTYSTATLATTNDAATLVVEGAAGAAVYMPASNWNGTIVFEASADGTNYVGWPIAGLTGSIATQTTTNGATTWVGNTAGFQTVRARVSVVNAGGFSVVVSVTSTPGSSHVSVPGLTLSQSSVNTSTVVTNIKTTPGQLYVADVYNPHSAACYMQIFNATAANVTLGTTAPTLSFGVVNATGRSVSLPHGADFSTAISIAGTTTRAGSTGCGAAAGAAGLDMNVMYK